MSSTSNRLKMDIGASRSFVKAFGFRPFLRRAAFAAFVRPYRRYTRGSYSQGLEDLLIDEMLGRKEHGFYVDIGANDPVRANNTMRFYRKGWTGINVEPNGLCYKRLVAKRPKDINLNVGIAAERGKRAFYSFLPDTRSTFSATVAARLVREGLELSDESQVETWPLSLLFSLYCSGMTVDLLSLDTEGYDEEVLESNDWASYRPSVICVEQRNDTRVDDLLVGRGYILAASTPHNAIYRLWGDR